MMNGTKRAVILDQFDSVANAIEDIEPGDMVSVSPSNGETIRAVEKIPFGFKIARWDIEKDKQILKYGQVIGISTLSIKKGECVHIHNVAGNRGRGDLPRAAGSAGSTGLAVSE